MSQPVLHGWLEALDVDLHDIGKADDVLAVVSAVRSELPKLLQAGVHRDDVRTEITSRFIRVRHAHPDWWIPAVATCYSHVMQQLSGDGKGDANQREEEPVVVVAAPPHTDVHTGAGAEALPVDGVGSAQPSVPAELDSGVRETDALPTPSTPLVVSDDTTPTAASVATAAGFSGESALSPTDPLWDPIRRFVSAISAPALVHNPACPFQYAHVHVHVRVTTTPPGPSPRTARVTVSLSLAHHTVAGLKEAVKLLIGAPAFTLRAVHRGRALDDHLTPLNAYGVQPGDVVRLVPLVVPGPRELSCSSLVEPCKIWKTRWHFQTCCIGCCCTHELVERNNDAYGIRVSGDLETPLVGGCWLSPLCWASLCFCPMEFQPARHTARNVLDLRRASAIGECCGSNPVCMRCAVMQEAVVVRQHVGPDGALGHECVGATPGVPYSVRRPMVENLATALLELDRRRDATTGIVGGGGGIGANAPPALVSMV